MCIRDSYDTSGPYTDPNVTIDVRKGLADVRSAWIEDRGDTEKLPGLSSEFGQRRLNDAELTKMRFAHVRNPRRAKAGHNVSQMHYAKKGIITPEMEYVAIRENMKLAEAREAGLLGEQHAGHSFGAAIPKAVSYTHLDVYKRQRVCAGEKSKCDWPCSNSSPVLLTMTH